MLEGQVVDQDFMSPPQRQPPVATRTVKPRAKEPKNETRARAGRRAVKWAIMALYDADFYRWTQDTSERLRRGEFAGIDVRALAEEVEDLGKKEKLALESRLAVLIGHLLKWDFQPAKRSKSWQATIQLQRGRIERLFKGSPSLRGFLPEILADAYSDAVLLAVRETGLDRAGFAEQCPYTIEEILTGKDVSVHC